MNILFLSLLFFPFFFNLKKRIILWLPPLFFFLLAMQSKIQIGHRHLLPVYPFLFLMCGGTGKRFLELEKKWKPLSLFLIYTYPLNSFLIFPHYLAYFNGILLPSRAYEWVADSNIDWGQDLKGLKKWVEKKGLDKIYLGYYGTADPNYYKIPYRYLPSTTANLDRYHYTPMPKGKEIIAISVTTYHSLYVKDLSFYRWLHKFKPFTSIGYSILLFDITENIVAHLHLGINYYRSMLFQEAKEEFEKVVRKDPQNPYAWFNLGKVYEIMGEKEKAINCMERALKFCGDKERVRIKRYIEELKKK